MSSSYQWRCCNQDCVSPTGRHTWQCYRSKCCGVMATSDDAQDWGYERLKGKTLTHAQTRTAEPTNAWHQTHPSWELELPVCVCFNSLSVDRVEAWQLLWNVSEWQDSGARRLGVTGGSAADGAWDQWLERSTWLLLDIYLNDNSASVTCNSQNLKN